MEFQPPGGVPRGQPYNKEIRGRFQSPPECSESGPEILSQQAVEVELALLLLDRVAAAVV